MSVTGMAINRLRDEIVNGRYQYHEKLTEVALCKKMGVSRTTIRKAFEALAGEGLLERIKGYGVIVSYCQYDSGHFKEMLAMLEEFALAKTLKLKNKVFLTELKTLQEQMEKIAAQKPKKPKAEPADTKVFSMLDDKFHKIIAESAGNPLLLEFIELIQKKGNLPKPEDRIWDRNIMEDNIEQHRTMLRMIEENKEFPSQLVKSSFPLQVKSK